MAFRILVSQSWFGPVLLAVESRGLKHWIVSEVPSFPFYFKLHILWGFVKFWFFIVPSMGPHRNKYIKANDFNDNDVSFTCCMSSFSKSTFLHNLPTHVLLMLSISSRTLDPLKLPGERLALTGDPCCSERTSNREDLQWPFNDSII